MATLFILIIFFGKELQGNKAQLKSQYLIS